MLRKLLMVTAFPLNLLTYRRQTWKLALMSMVTVPVYATLLPLPTMQPTVTETSDYCVDKAQRTAAEWQQHLGGGGVVFYENDSLATALTDECHLDTIDYEGDGK